MNAAAAVMRQRELWTVLIERKNSFMAILSLHHVLDVCLRTTSDRMSNTRRVPVFPLNCLASRATGLGTETLAAATAAAAAVVAIGAQPEANEGAHRVHSSSSRAVAGSSQAEGENALSNARERERERERARERENEKESRNNVIGSVTFRKEDACCSLVSHDDRPKRGTGKRDSCDSFSSHMHVCLSD